LVRMKLLPVKLGIIFILVLVFGCSAINNLITSSMGQPISTIIDRFGPPSRVTPDGKGGSIYIWEQWVHTGWGPGYLWSLSVWTDANGNIYNWR
jgi:hypothetical protein